MRTGKNKENSVRTKQRRAENTLDLLKQLYRKNYEAAAFYEKAAYFTKRILFKHFFRKLYLQKKSFLASLKEIISGYDKSLEIDWEKLNAPVCGCPSAPEHLNSCSRNKIITRAYKNEKQCHYEYVQCIARIKDKNCLETLVLQRGHIHNTLREMQAFGVNKFLI